MGRTAIDEVGNRYSRLLVIKRSSQNSTNGHARWLCRCDCGTNTTVIGNDLRARKARSCGCFKCENTIAMNHGRALPWGQASFNALYSKYKYAAKRRGLKFELTKEDFSFLTKMNCFYCGSLPSKTIQPPSCTTSYIYSGIDRLNNSKDYTMDNVVPCCERCNKMKGTNTVEKFKEHLLNIVEYRNWRKDDKNRDSG